MKDLICIVCPRGCHLTIDNNLSVTGNFCPRGEKYAQDEITHPSRIITTFMRVINRPDTMVSVKTSKPVPKDKIFEFMEEINKTFIVAPCYIGQIAIKSVLGFDVDILITKNID